MPGPGLETLQPLVPSMLVNNPKSAQAKAATPCPPINPNMWVSRTCVICTGAPACQVSRGPIWQLSGLVLLQGAVREPLGSHLLPQWPLPPPPDPSSCLTSSVCRFTPSPPAHDLGSAAGSHGSQAQSCPRCSSASQSPRRLRVCRPSPSS